jgi:hypothetical protein
LDLRIGFEEAINEPKLLKERFAELALAQQVALKVLYGLPLSSTTVDERTGLNELDYWAVLQGNADYTELGYIRNVQALEYTPKRYSECWAIMGRRAGKSDALASTVVAYEAALGGHEQHVRRGQVALCFQIAQDLRMARYSLGFIRATLESSPLLKGLITAITADRIDLKNNLTIAVVPPTLKSVRGYANPVAVLDEVGVWYQDSDSANPDYEIWRAVKPGQTQFPNKMLMGISSPWNKAGLLFNYYEAGTDGRHVTNEDDRDRYKNCLVVHGTTAGMGNPRVDPDWLRQEMRRDPRAFEREYLAVFQDSLTGFLNSALLRDCIDPGVAERPPVQENYYVAAMDPAFRRDAFAFTIVHAEHGQVVQDVVRRWIATDGVPLNPTTILSEIAALMKAYRCVVAYSDQYHLDTLQQLAINLGFAIESIPFTATSKASIFGNLQQLVNQRRLRLLDHAETLRELRSIERTLKDGGSMSISAPSGMHDDLAAVVAIAVQKCTWLLPAEPEAVPQEPTPFERIQQQLERKQVQDLYTAWD